MQTEFFPSTRNVARMECLVRLDISSNGSRACIYSQLSHWFKLRFKKNWTWKLEYVMPSPFFIQILSRFMHYGERYKEIKTWSWFFQTCMEMHSFFIIQGNSMRAHTPMCLSLTQNVHLAPSIQHKMQNHLPPHFLTSFSLTLFPLLCKKKPPST